MLQDTFWRRFRRAACVTATFGGIMTPMPPPVELVRLLLALLMAAPLAGCGGADPAPSGDRPIVARADTPDVAQSVEDPNAPRIISVVVTDGRLTGDTGVVEVKRNVPVRLVVITDDADTIVVEGYDLTALATAEVPVQLDFIADEPGEHRVVMRDSGLELTRLRVR